MSLRTVGRTLAALLLAQAALLGLWWGVERRRAGWSSGIPAGAGIPLDQPAPPLAAQRPDGHAALRPKGPLVLHVWATWCAPCVAELPSLLAYAAEGELPVWAVSVDDGWAPVRRFFDGPIPAAVVRMHPKALPAALQVDRLPVSFVIDGADRLRLRLEGPRDWASGAVRAQVRAASMGRVSTGQVSPGRVSTGRPARAGGAPPPR